MQLKAMQIKNLLLTPTQIFINKALTNGISVYIDDTYIVLYTK